MDYYISLFPGAGGSGPGDRGPSGAPPGSSTPQGGDSTQDKKSPAVSQWWQRTGTPKPGGSFETRDDDPKPPPEAGANARPNAADGSTQESNDLPPLSEGGGSQEMGVAGISRAYLHWLQLHQQLQQELARFYFGYGINPELGSHQGPQDLSKKSKR